MDFIEKHGKNIVIGFGAIIVLGLVVTLISQGSTKKEVKAQEAYISIERQLKKYKEQNQNSIDKVNDDSAKKVESKKEVIDVNVLKTELESFVNSHLSTVASQMAALELAQILEKEGKLVESVQLLQKATTQSDLLSNGMIQMKTAQLLADNQKCNEAVLIWQKIENLKGFAFLHSEAKLNRALCFKQMNDVAKAEEILNQIKNTKPNAEESIEGTKEADKVLKLIQFNKQKGS